MTHRFPLGGTSWSVWRDALLRTTGFPAAGLDRLTGPECAAVADAYLAGSADLGAFQAQYAIAQSVTGPEGGEGVRMSGIALGDPQGRMVYQPDHPLADAAGYIRMPDIDLGSQMSQLIMAQRGFQAQASVIRNAQDVYASALSIGKQS